MSSSAAAPRVLLGGWYGAANLGDELLLATFARWVREAGAAPAAIGVHPRYTAVAHGLPAVGYDDLPAIAEAMAESDLFVLGGGGLFQDYDRFDEASLAAFPARNVSQFAQYALLAQALGVPLAVLGQGLGPLRGAEGRAIAARVYAQADAVSLRDAASLALLRAIGVAREAPVAPDPAWAHVAPPRSVAAAFPALAGRPVLALVVRDWPFDPAWEAAFVAAFREAMPAAWACLWLDFTRVPDATGTQPVYTEIAHRLVPQLPGPAHAVWSGMQVDEAAGLLAGCDAVLAMRLHGALLGHAAGRPVLALEYDGKVQALGDDLALPAAQRMALAEIPARLPQALRSLVAAPAAWATVPAARRAALARDALMHRDCLHAALGAALRGPRRPLRLGPPVTDWFAALDAAGRARVERAVAAREAR